MNSLPSDLESVGASIDPLASTLSLPDDPTGALLVGRVDLPASACRKGVGGPTVVRVASDGVFDLSDTFPTMADLLDDAQRLEKVADGGRRIGSLEAILSNTHFTARDGSTAFLLSPFDLQTIKACGVTFATSMLERVIEERAGGDPGRAEEIRERLNRVIGHNLRSIVPASPEAKRLSDWLRKEGLWSQYLEVGIGEDAEIFTKTSVLSSVGTGARIGIRRTSVWNNPEPEVVLAVNANNQIVGASLGNDVNLRDFEGRSALLLSLAKDFTGSCSIGPFIRLFEYGAFDLDQLMESSVDMLVTGRDGFVMRDSSKLAEISRSPQDLVEQVTRAHPRMADGFALFLGTPFAPTVDRQGPGSGFTHHHGDMVRISNPHLGALTNWVDYADELPPAAGGVREFMRNLYQRDLL